METLTQAVLPFIAKDGHVFDPNQHCVVCHGALGILRMAIFANEVGGIEMHMVVRMPVVSAEKDADYRERVDEALAIVDKPGCLKAFMYWYAMAREGLAN